MPILQTFSLIFCFIICVTLIFLILIQSSKGGGLGMFGGGSANTAFGASTMDIVTKLTWWLVLGFFLFAIIAAISFSEGGIPEIQEVKNIQTPETQNKTDKEGQAPAQELNIKKKSK